MGKKYKKKKYRKLVEIKTNKFGWKVVEFLGWTLDHKKMILKFKNGEIVRRKVVRVRMSPYSKNKRVAYNGNS